LTKESRRYYNGQIAWAVAHADHILTISEATARDLREMLGVPPEKITMNLLGVEPTFRPQRGDVIAEMRERFGLPTSYLLFVGVFEPRKNIPNLLRAYRLLSGRTPPLVLAGRRGWLYEESFALIESLDLQDRVIVLEDVPQGDLPTLYSGAVLHLLPSFYEGFGLPALEAMACGTPTLVSDRGALPEVVGDVGTLIDPDHPDDIARAIHDLLKDSGRRLEMTALGLAHAATFTWKRTAEVVYDVYQEVLEDL
jgi:glycosyltransferase involved in cell wall biosynthesis